MSDRTTFLKTQLESIVPSPKLHAKWLNSLSMMENTGARKISKYEHPVHTGIIVLKHAAEEARHAYYLKKQIEKTGEECPDYSFPYLLAPMESYHYLHQLDVSVCRYLYLNTELRGRDLFHGAYLLVTYAIEVRADSLYGVYQDVLTANQSKVNVKSIIAEEEGHLEEMTNMLVSFHPEWEQLATDACAIEDKLFNAWVDAVAKELNFANVILN